MKVIFLFLVLLHNFPGISQTLRIDTIYSVILEEDRYIWLGLPESKEVYSRYPVVYVLDGQVFFDEARNILGQLTKEEGKKAAGEMIVVGLGNIWQRYRDYTPSRITSSPWVDSLSASVSGGGEKFIAFLRDELFPYMQSKYGTSSSRILLGHSIGGLLAMNILLKHADLFDCYAAIDPSLWWDDEKLLKESGTILKEKIFEGKSLYLAVANTTDMDMDFLAIRKDRSEKTALIRPSLSLVDIIRNNKKNKLRFEWKFYSKQHHTTVVSPGFYDALKFFLEKF